MRGQRQQRDVDSGHRQVHHAVDDRGDRRGADRDAGHDEGRAAPEPQRRAQHRHELQWPAIADAGEPQRGAGEQRGGKGGDPQIALFVGKHGGSLERNPPN